ncbi:family 20 glycosylhydrolase [Lutibacter sp.]|uniref:glycoside hydrolase family 20 protein n=1 Tax=Lutibacter sp. TaxID=1925666 RepID=UPI00356689B8
MNISKIIVLTVVLITISCQQEPPKRLGIIPEPAHIQYQDGYFEINEQTVIVIDESEDAKSIANELITFLKNQFSLSIEVSTTAQNNAIFLTKVGEQVQEGAYDLTVSKKGIAIRAGTYQGIFYGVQTIKQLLSPKNSIQKPILSLVTIKDAPEFKWRGMMLDVSRHFLPKDSVKQVIDILAMHKMNKFHWHLVDGIGWRIQIDKYPMLTQKGAWRKVKENRKPWEEFEVCEQNFDGEVYGGYYTKEDIKEIVAYAAERYIEVIPEIEMPGHSEAALQCYPEFMCKGVEATGVYCAGNDGAFTFLQNIITEVVELFPSQYLHIGGDEVGKEGWLQCSDCKQRMATENLKNADELQSYFVKRMEQFIHSKNKKLIGWDEILEGGLPERATVMSWRGVKGGIEAANEGHDVVMSPGSPCYFDHSQGSSEFEPPSWGGYNNLLKVYEFHPIPNEIAADKKHHILGGQANLWTEQITSLNHIQYMILPRISALSEALWTPSTQKNKEKFIDKLDVQFDRFQELGYEYATSSLTPNYQVSYDKTTQQFNLRLANELNRYEIRYTLDGSEPTLNSTVYTKPIRYTSPIHLHAVCFRNGEQTGYPLIKMFSTSFSDQCTITYTNAYNDAYSGGGAEALFDQKFAISRGDDPHWQGFKKEDFEVTIDLGSVSELSYIGLNFFQHIGSTSVMLPTNVSIAISKDGKNYLPVLNSAIETIEKRDPFIKRIETNFEKQKVGFIKIVAKNRGTLPEWHIRKGAAWIFVDELSIK